MGTPLLLDWVVDRTVGDYRLRAAFTTRHGGVSQPPYDSLNFGYHVGDRAEDVEENRQRLAATVKTPVVYMDQVHGDHVEYAEVLASQHVFTAPATDSLLVELSARSGLNQVAGAVMVADCVPLLLVSRTRPVGAVVHAGRKGVLNGIGPKTASLLGDISQVEAYIGPSICSRCYEVPENMAEESERICPGISSTTSWGTPSLDLPGALASQLSAAGITSIHRSYICTFESTNHFSYRRSKHTGRTLGVLHIHKTSGVF